MAGSPPMPKATGNVRNARHRGQLTEREQQRVDELAKLDRDAYLKAVYHYMATFRDADRRIFRSGKLAARTHEALSIIRKPVVEQINTIGRPVDLQQKRRRARLEQLAGRMKKERTVLDALLKASEPGQGKRLSAAWVVAHALDPDALGLATRLLVEDGLSMPQAVVALRAIVLDEVDRETAVRNARAQTAKRD